MGMLVSHNSNRENIGTHVKLSIIGDSLTANTSFYGGISSNLGAGFWNWANWMIGAPFELYKIGIPGARVKSIFSCIASIPANIQAVAIMAGTNDVYGTSSSSTQEQIDAIFATVSADITSCINNLIAARKKILISTIPPCDAYSVSTDARIQLLDRLNTFILSLESNTILVVDSFTAVWDSTLPTVRMFKSGCASADGIHITASGAMLIGVEAKDKFKTLYNMCYNDIDIYSEYYNARSLYNSFRSGTGGNAPIKTHGTGTLADGWRSRNVTGTATFTLANTESYSISSEYIGHSASVANDKEEYFQEVNISSASASDQIRLENSVQISNSTSFPELIVGGFRVFGELDVMILSPINLQSVTLNIVNFFTQGTSPVDMAYINGSYISVSAGESSGAGLSIHPMQAGNIRYMLRTPVLRSPENINSTLAQTLYFNIDTIFFGTGSAIIKFGRPRLYVCPY